MKTKERLAYMDLGGFLVIAGMTLGQFVFSPAGRKGNTKGLAAVMRPLEGRTVGSVLQESKSDLLESCEACGNLVSKTA